MSDAEEIRIKVQQIEEKETRFYETIAVAINLLYDMRDLIYSLKSNDANMAVVTLRLAEDNIDSANSRVGEAVQYVVNWSRKA